MNDSVHFYYPVSLIFTSMDKSHYLEGLDGHYNGQKCYFRTQDSLGGVGTRSTLSTSGMMNESSSIYQLS